MKYANKIIVTGGCGFIGSNLVDKLISDGHEVVVIDNLSSDAHDQFYFNDKATYYEEDVSKSHAVNGIFERHRPDYVFHLAAEARIQNCINTPSKALNSNTMGTQNILEAARMYGTKRVILSSTSAIYGLSEEAPQKESQTPDCLNMYSYSKWFSEGLCKLYSSLYSVDTVCMRYFNAYGPRQPVRGSYAPVIGVFSRQKKAGEPMTVVGDGLQTRDYVHVSDIVSANIACMNNQTNLNGEIINIGTGTAHSVLDIAKMMEGQYVFVAARKGEARHTLADNTKAKTILGWSVTKDLTTYLTNKEYLT
jgi:UDP-glucose 4-epimerase